MTILKTPFKSIDQQVQNLIRQANREIILPAYKNHIDEKNIFVKNDHSIVTTIDYEAQSFLQNRLQALLPNSGFLGEEQIELRKNIAKGDWVWILDPIDGTHNFATRKDDFGTMLSLWHLPTNRPICGWIYLSVSDVMFSGGIGEGVFYNGKNLKEQAPYQVKSVDKMTGLLNYGSFGEAQNAMWRNGQEFGLIDTATCAIVKFAALLQNQVDFAVFGRAKIWDLSAGFALLEEMGGHAARVKGNIDDPHTLSLIDPSSYADWSLAVRQKSDWTDIRDTLFKNVV